MRLGFAGTPQFAVPALDALVKSRHRVVAIYTQPDRPSGRGQTLHMSPVKHRATELQLPLFQPASLRTQAALDAVRALGLDALVVVAYGLILPATVLAAPELGCFNIHASLLPRWRGAAPIHRALLAGDTATGITIMRMDAGLDTGPMLAARSVQMAPRETAGSLHDRLAALGGELIVETLDAVAAGSVTEMAQPAAGITYAAKLDKTEARIDWHDAATAVLRRVRAFNPWPIAETTLAGAQLRIWEAELAPARVQAEPAGAARVAGTVLEVSDEGVDVACGDGVLRMLRMQLPGRKPLAAREFIRAQRLAGSRLGSQ